MSLNDRRRKSPRSAPAPLGAWNVAICLEPSTKPGHASQECQAKGYTQQKCTPFSPKYMTERGTLRGPGGLIMIFPDPPSGCTCVQFVQSDLGTHEIVEKKYFFSLPLVPDTGLLKLLVNSWPEHGEPRRSCQGDPRWAPGWLPARVGSAEEQSQDWKFKFSVPTPFPREGRGARNR